MRVLITGSREWTDYLAIERALVRVARAAYMNGASMTLVSGHCPQGADAIAEDIATKLGWNIELHPAQWDGPAGRGAGFARNQAMVDTRPDLCLAFPAGRARGTRHCMAAAIAAGIPTLDHTGDHS